MSATLRATAIGFIAILLWAALALLTTQAEGIPPFEKLTICFAVAFLGGAVGIAAGGRRAVRSLVQPPAVWISGFAGLFGYHALYFFALDLAPPADASLIAYLWPLLIVLLSALTSGQGLKARHLIGALLGFGGTALLVLRGRDGGAGGVPVVGYALAFACALVWSGYSVFNRRFQAVPSTVIGGICGLVAVAGALCHFALEPTVIPTVGQGVALVTLGLGPLGIAFFAWDHATKHGNVPVLGSLSYLAPLLSTLLLIAFGRSDASVTVLGAAVLILAGAVVATARPARRSKPA